MSSIRNEDGSVLVFMTLMIVLLMIMVGMGLDTGQLTYTRATGQGAVDAAALSAVSAIPTSDINQVRTRATAFATANTHLDSAKNPITGAHVTLMKYDFATGNLVAEPDITLANAARVALETKNPYDAGATNSPMKSPLFLTPLFNLFGINMGKTADVSVSAVAVATAIPTLPIVVYDSQCNLNPIKIRATSDPLETGCWTTFFDSSTSKPDVVGLMKATATCDGISQGVRKGDIIHLNDGTQKPDYDAADDLFKAFTGQCWIVPVVKAPLSTAKSNNCGGWEEIVDFAKICPTEVVSTKSPKYIQANITCGQDPNTSRDALCFASRLVRDKASGM
jgi:Flp pilus assembly protein TadG